MDRTSRYAKFSDWLVNRATYFWAALLTSTIYVQNIDFWKYIHNFENDFLYFYRPFNLHPKKLFWWFHLRFFRDWTWKKYSTHVGTFKAFWILVCFNLLFWSLALRYRDSIKCLGNVGSESIAQIWNSYKRKSWRNFLLILVNVENFTRGLCKAHHWNKEKFQSHPIRCPKQNMSLTQKNYVVISKKKTFNLFKDLP